MDHISHKVSSLGMPSARMMLTDNNIQGSPRWSVRCGDLTLWGEAVGLGFAEPGGRTAVGYPNSHQSFLTGRERQAGEHRTLIMNWEKFVWVDLGRKEKNIPTRVIKHCTRVLREIGMFDAVSEVDMQSNWISRSHVYAFEVTYECEGI